MKQKQRPNSRSEKTTVDETGVLGGIDLLRALDETRSATQTAARLGTTTATVLRRLEALEARLGARLFDRLPTGLRPTPAVDLARPWAEQAHAAGAALLREICNTEQTASGVVRLAVPPAVAALFVVPALPSLRALHPDIVLELAPATAVVDLTLREADLAIRTFRPESGDLVVQRLARARLAVVRAPSLRLPRGHDPRTSLPWLGWDRSLAHIPEMSWLLAHVKESRIVFRATELSILLRAAQQGVGALVVAEPIARRAGGLVEVDVGPMPSGGVHLVAHRALRGVPRVAAVWDWLLRSFTVET